MMKKKQGMTYKEHRDMGEIIYRLERSLFCVLAKYPKSSKVGRKADALYKILNELRSALDDAVCDENPITLHPDRQPEKLYYGRTDELFPS